MSAITISPDHLDGMAAHVAAEAPLEACGLLAGKAATCHKVYPLENELRSPTRFRIAPQAQIAAFEDMEAEGLDLLAIYHSHPQGPPQPSATDIAEAFYPEALQLIWSPGVEGWTCRAFRIGADGASAVELRSTQGQATSP